MTACDWTVTDPEMQSAWRPALSTAQLSGLQRVCPTKRQGAALALACTLLLCAAVVLSHSTLQHYWAGQIRITGNEAAQEAAAPAGSPPPPRMYPRKHTKAPECVAAHTDGVEGCLHVRQACVDQGEVVMMGEEYIPDITHPSWAPGAVEPLPEYTASHGMPYIVQFGGAASNGDFFASMQEVPPVTFRARSNVEPTPDLRHPEYDNSTVPVVFHPTWMYNHAHVLMSSVAWIYNNLNQSGDADLALRAQMVVRTPHGWDLPPFMRPLLQPLLRQPIQTFAELSARLEPGTKHSRPRCFCNMLFCSSYEHTVSPNVWHATQALAASYTTKQQRQQRQRQAAASAGAPNVVFHTRTVAVRQFANQAELIKKCSEWSWGQEAQGGVPRANCSTHVFTDVPSSIAAAQAADIFVAIHGANVPNGFFMRPGSAMIEIMHPDWPHSFDSLLDQDPTHELIYFGLIVNAKHWTPGAYEQQQNDAGLIPYSNNKATAGRDRNVHIKWKWLQPVLDRIASLQGNMTLYRQIKQEDRVVHIG